MTDFSSLIALMEQATEGSRELDAKVWAAILPRDGIGLDGYGLPDGGHYEYEADDFKEGRVTMLAVLADETRHRRASRPAPPYTSEPYNLTQALSLMPEGWMLEHLGHDASGQRGALKVAGVTAEVSDGHTVYQGQAPTPALALVTAILRARSKTP